MLKCLVNCHLVLSGHFNVLSVAPLWICKILIINYYNVELSKSIHVAVSNEIPLVIPIYEFWIPGILKEYVEYQTDVSVTFKCFLLWYVWVIGIIQCIFIENFSTQLQTDSKNWNSAGDKRKGENKVKSKMK